VSLDLHDFSVVNNRMDTLLRLKELHPNCKVSLFTVPVDQPSDFGPWLIRDDLLKMIKYHLGWIQIIPHGYRHTGQEMRNVDYGEFKTILDQVCRTFDREGLPFEKGFCAPHWKWAHGVVKVLDEEGWWMAVHPDHPSAYMPKRVYRFSHSIHVQMPKDVEVVKLHGHLYGTKNDLGRCMWNLMNIPKDAEWHFVSDFVEEA
jgi:hypothetical protein